MHISLLEIENIRSFEKIKLELSPHINLLVGANNSGKSTIIKSIYGLQANEYLVFDDVRKNTDEGKICMRLEDLTPTDRKLFSSNPGSERVAESCESIRVYFHLHVGEESRDNKREEFFQEEETLNLGGVDQLASKQMRDFTKLPDDETKKNFIYPFFAKRKVQGYSRHSNGRDTAFKVSYDLSNLVSRIQNITNDSHPQAARFKECVRDILQFDIGLIPYRSNEVIPGIFINNSQTIDIERMGEGVVNIIGMIALLLTENNKLYLIEEPENDIHPAALKKLLNLVIEKSAANQFVISTHSNIVVKYLGIPGQSKIFSLQWQPFDKHRFKIPTTKIEALDDEPASKIKLLTDLGYDLLDFDLFSSYLIFEESSAERIVRDFLIPWFVPALHNKVRTIASHGVSDLKTRSIDFMRLFVFIHATPVYHNKAWVFADGDAEGKKCIKELQDTFANWNKEQFQYFAAAYFEEYYPQPYGDQFKEIQKISNVQEKREAKKTLLNDLVTWAGNNPEKAKKKFAYSFSEVIMKLKTVEKALATK